LIKTLPNSNIRHSFIELVKKATTFDAAAKINADMFTYVCKCGKIAHFLSKAELAENGIKQRLLRKLLFGNFKVQHWR